MIDILRLISADATQVYLPHLSTSGAIYSSNDRATRLTYLTSVSSSPHLSPALSGFQLELSEYEVTSD
jgi:hypothetical protein